MGPDQCVRQGLESFFDPDSVDPDPSRINVFISDADDMNSSCFSAVACDTPEHPDVKTFVANGFDSDELALIFLESPTTSESFEQVLIGSSSTDDITEEIEFVQDSRGEMHPSSLFKEIELQEFFRRR
jgi:hypothetical protein